MAYPATIWAKAKADYETGNFSIPKLYEKYTINEQTIKNRIAKEGWVKGKHIPAIQQGIAERNIALFAKHGMTQDIVVKKLVEGVFLPEKTVEKLSDFIKENNPSNAPEGSESDSKRFFKGITSIINQLVDDKRVSLSYLQELNKMCGTYAPVKREITGKDGEPLVPESNNLEDIKKSIKALLDDKS